MATWSVGCLFVLFALTTAVVLLVFLVWAAMRAARSFKVLEPPSPEEPMRPAPFLARTPLPAAAPRQGDTSAACPECGAALPADSPHGLCARCLFQRAMLSP